MAIFKKSFVMNTQALKENLHKQVDALQDEIALQLLHDAAVDYNRFSGNDVFDTLSEEQKRRLAHSIQQADEGNTIPHDEAMKRIAQWRNK